MTLHGYSSLSDSCIAVVSDKSYSNGMFTFHSQMFYYKFSQLNQHCFSKTSVLDHNMNQWSCLLVTYL